MKRLLTAIRARLRRHREPATLFAERDALCGAARFRAPELPEAPR
jgi:hypothetical protein